MKSFIHLLDIYCVYCSSAMLLCIRLWVPSRCDNAADRLEY